MKAFNEPCDDNNTLPNDGCSPTCTIELNGHCTHPLNAPSICDICGNSLQKPPELCDDGSVNSEGCAPDCLSALSTWNCTGGSPTQIDICLPVYGDGILVGAEVCDDGNPNISDGCSHGTIDPGYICLGLPSICALCGDGLL